MSHDEEAVRWEATQLLKQHVDGSFDEQLKALQLDPDLRKRGLAAYLAVNRWKAASFPFIKQLLSEKSQLLRFDAVSALLLEGGPEGRKLVLAHAAEESHPRLKLLIEREREKPAESP